MGGRGGSSPLRRLASAEGSGEPPGSTGATPAAPTLAPGRSTRSPSAVLAGSATVVPARARRDRPRWLGPAVASVTQRRRDPVRDRAGSASPVSCSRWWCRSWGRRGRCRRAASGRRTACRSGRRCGRTLAGWAMVDGADSDASSAASWLRRLDRRRVGGDVGALAGLDDGLLDAGQRGLGALAGGEDAELAPLLLRQVLDRQAAEQVVHQASWRCGCPGRRSCRRARSACR